MSKLAYYVLVLIGALIFTNCKRKEVLKESESVNRQTDLFYHYSIWYAFVNKVFEGDLTVKELKTKGDIGLGSYSKLDGELVMLDGISYQVTEDGKVSVPKDDAKIVYVNATHFEKDLGFNLSEKVNYDALREKINTKLPSKNMLYGFKIHGNFKSIKCGGLHKQEPPFKDGLDVLIPKRPVFERENVSGTMVGFFCPEFIGNINVAGYHLHFISDDKTFGGHVMDFEADDLKVAMDEMNEYQFVLPKTEAYRKVGFEKEFQYKKN
jgi:acetolactate decarboxylase